MTDLATRYLGLELAHPVVASAGPLTGRIETLVQLEEAGAAAVVLPSLFEEDIERASRRIDAILTQGTESFGEALTYLPEVPDLAVGPDRYLELVSEASSLLSIPVIASLNGTTTGGWVRYAKTLADAGADAIELNAYFVAADPDQSAADVERRYLELVEAVREAVTIPLAVKMSPYLSALAHTAVQLDAAGADGLVLFNRFYQPEIDLETLDVSPTLDLSMPGELRLPLRWVALLAGRVGCSLALSSGVHTSYDVVKAVLAGADAVMSTSALLLHGPSHVTVLRDGLATWLAEREYVSVAEARGSVSRRAVADPDAYERANYLEVLRRATERYLDLA